MRYKDSEDAVGISGYLIYEDGRVFSKLSNKFLKPQETNKGYLRVELRGTPYFVHRLVALAFVPNPEDKEQVNHINCNKKYNHARNLEWVTNQENHTHKCMNGLNVSLSGKEHYAYGKRGKDWHSSKAVYQLDLEGNFIREWDSMADAARHYSIDKSGISKCCRGVISHCKGFKWRYKP